MRYENVALHINRTEHKFEMETEGCVAFIDYKQSGKKMYLIHTEVPPQLEGQGVGSALVEKTLQYLKDNQLQVVPNCVFVQQYIKRHPEWNDLLQVEED